MRERHVILTAKAIADIVDIHTYISQQASRTIADTYVTRLKKFIQGFDIASERGTLRTDIAEQLRVVGFEGRLTIAFKVTPSEVFILRVFRGGQDWQRLLHS